MIKLGVNSVLFRDFDFKTAAEHIVKAGFDGIEISAIKGMCEHLDLDNWKAQKNDLKKIVEDLGTQFISCEEASLDEDRLKNAFEAAAEIGIPVINVGPSGKMDVMDDLKECVETLQKRSEIAEKFGISLCCKAHVGASIHDTKTTLYAMEHITSPAFGVDMDPSHIYRAGEDPEIALPAVLSRVKHIHIRDCLGRQQGPGAVQMQACGRGDINLYGYCQAMVDGKYDGPVSLEVIGVDGLALSEVAIIAAETHGYLNACLKHLGAR